MAGGIFVYRGGNSLDCLSVDLYGPTAPQPINRGAWNGKSRTVDLIHALADSGQDGPDHFFQCTCGMRTWGDDDDEAWESFKFHRGWTW